MNKDKELDITEALVDADVNFNEFYKEYRARTLVNAERLSESLYRRLRKQLASVPPVVNANLDKSAVTLIRRNAPSDSIVALVLRKCFVITNNWCLMAPVGYTSNEALEHLAGLPCASFEWCLWPLDDALADDVDAKNNAEYRLEDYVKSQGLRHELLCQLINVHEIYW